MQNAMQMRDASRVELGERESECDTSMTSMQNAMQMRDASRFELGKREKKP